MRRLILLAITAILILPATASVCLAEIEADVDDVRLMLTAPDNQDFSIFESESLANALVEIIEDDPVDADYHDRVVAGALVVLGEMHPPDTVDVFIGKLDEYTTTCLYWLGTFASPDAVEAIAGYLDNDKPSIRYEAASALGTVPLADIDEENENEELTEALNSATEILQARLEVEEDESVLEALREAIAHIE